MSAVALLALVWLLVSVLVGVGLCLLFTGARRGAERAVRPLPLDEPVRLAEVPLAA